MKYLQHLIKPQTLILTWKGFEPASGSGRRFVVGFITYEKDVLTLRYYDSEEVHQAKNQYGFRGFAAYDYDLEDSNQPFTKNLDYFLKQRIITPARADYSEYLQAHRIDPATQPSPDLLQLLAYTGGTIAGDGFSFAPDLNGLEPPYDCLIEIAGFRHSQEAMAIQPIQTLQEQPVTLRSEPDNQKDPHAVAVYYKYQGVDKKIGYLPRGYADNFANHVLASYQANGFITKINGTIERPRVFIRVEIRDR